MSIHFECPTGAAADVKELEYISALHQTDPTELRQNGSINDVDISHFLLSRFGIKVTTEQVQTEILRGLSCSNKNCIDLMEMVSILFIPTLLKVPSPKETTEGLVPPPRDLLHNILRMVLHDITGDAEPKLLTPELLKLVFTKYDEPNLASDEELLYEMIEAVSKEKEDVMFNVETFAKGLTYDVIRYDVRNENKFSVNLTDVLSSGRNGTLSCREKDIEEGPKEEYYTGETDTKVLERSVTFSAIDLVAGTYRSKLLVVSLWAAFLVTYFTFYWRASEEYGGCPVFESGSNWDGNKDAFKCELLSNIRIWFLTFFLLSIYGLIFMGLGSMGNGMRVSNPLWPVFGVVVIACCTFIPTSVLDHSFRGFGGRFLIVTSVLLGSVAIAVHCIHFCGIVWPSIKDQPFWTKNLRPGNVVAESRGKKAAAHKVSLMAENALDVDHVFDSDNVVDSFFGQALLTFSKMGDHFNKAGGLRWTYDRMRSKNLSETEGISLSARFLASNFTQFILTIFILVVGVFVTRYISNEYDYDTNVAGGVSSLVYSLITTALPAERIQEVLELVEQLATSWVLLFLTFLMRSGVDISCEIITEYSESQINDACTDATYLPDCPFIELSSSSDDLCKLIDAASANLNSESGLTAENITTILSDLDILNNTDFDFDELYEEIAHTVGNATAASVESLYPEESYMLVLPFVLATAVAFFTATRTALVYIPSVVSTILKLRNGVIPTLTSKDFSNCRLQTNQITLLSGSMFWGVFFSSLLCGSLCGLILFIALWQVTRHLMLKVLAIAIGVLITLVIKMVVMRLFRLKFWRSFYRTHPALANIVDVITECANFALSVAFVFVRMTKFVFVAAFRVGRIDTYFFAPGVGSLWCWELDSYPSIFLTEVLAHEAHRHPYLELLGTMYLMKLQHGQDFGQRAGSCWRLIFVTALMPWLQKYRHLLQKDQEDNDDESDRNFNPVAVFKETIDDEGNRQFQSVLVKPEPLKPVILFHHSKTSCRMEDWREMNGSSYPVQDLGFPPLSPPNPYHNTTESSILDSQKNDKVEYPQLAETCSFNTSESSSSDQESLKADNEVYPPVSPGASVYVPDTTSNAESTNADDTGRPFSVAVQYLSTTESRGDANALKAREEISHSDTEASKKKGCHVGLKDAVLF